MLFPQRQSVSGRTVFFAGQWPGCIYPEKRLFFLLKICYDKSHYWIVKITTSIFGYMRNFKTAFMQRRPGKIFGHGSGRKYFQVRGLLRINAEL